MNKIDLSVILACYNEGPTFEKSVIQIVSVLKNLKRKWEIIFVEDKSTDDTARAVAKLTKSISNSRAIYHDKNMGRGKTVSDGILASKGKICGFLDVDLEVSAKYIPDFLVAIENGADMAVGVRFYEKGIKSAGRFIASVAYAKMVKVLLGLPIDDTETGYKFFRTDKVLSVIRKTRDNGWFWDTEICALAYREGLKIVQVPVRFVRRGDKKSTVRLLPDTWEYLVKIIRFKVRH